MFVYVYHINGLHMFVSESYADWDDAYEAYCAAMEDIVREFPQVNLARDRRFGGVVEQGA